MAIPRILWIALLSAACSDPGVILDGETKEIEANRAFVDRVPVILESTRTLALPDTLAQFDMSQPRRIAFAGAPTCRLAVTDALDRSVHIFHPNGDYDATIFGGGRNTSKLSSVGDMHFGSEGLIVVSDPMSRIVVFGLEGYLSEFQVEKPGSVVSFSSLAVVGSSLFDHWMLGAGKRIDTGLWPPDTPIMLRYSLDGHSEGAIGTIRTYPGRLLNLMMNQGTLAAGTDTVWFGRRADAVLFGYPLDGGVPRVVRPPLIHKMQTIREQPVPDTGGSTEVVLEYHLHDFDVDVSGNFFVLQAISWPRDEGSLFRPDLGLAVYSPEGKPLGLFDTADGEVRVVSVGDEFVFLLVQDRETGTVEVRRFDNPLGATGECS